MILPQAIKTAVNILETSGFECFAVGGCVRDFVMGRTPGDYDLTTNALPSEMISCFEGFRIIETGLKHGTVTVVIDGYNVEITTYRIDGEYKDNRRPESVSFTSELSEDLSRRDFTVNAMAFSEKCGIVDFFGGKEDIEHKTIRCVGSPDRRFGEDGLRILRALRFASVLDFGIESETALSIMRNRNLLKNISKERIFSELTKLVCGSGAERIIKEFSAVFETVLGEKLCAEGLTAVDNEPNARYSALLRNFENPARVLRSVRADNKTVSSVSKVCAYIGKNFETAADVKRLVRDIGAENAHILAKAKSAFEKSEKCLLLEQMIKDAEKTCCTLKQLAISGNDVVNLGFRGTAVGDALEFALDGVIDGLVENKKDNLSGFIKSMLDNQPIP